MERKKLKDNFIHMQEVNNRGFEMRIGVKNCRLSDDQEYSTKFLASQECILF